LVTGPNYATRHGVATAAVRALRDWAFERTDLIRLEIVIAVGNFASHRVAKKAGAVREGTLQRRLVLHGTVHDATMFSFTRAVSARSYGAGVEHT
jgi:ribosomal-protein-serine acetyltransferase